VTYYGADSSKEKAEALEAFQEGDARIFIGNPQSGGTGINLFAGSYVIYYSNDFELENRLQSEDRAHRIGQVNQVTYIDLVCGRSIDQKVTGALLKKKKLSDLVVDDLVGFLKCKGVS